MPTTERALTLRLPSDLHDQLREAAEREDRSIAAVIRVAARDYLAKTSRTEQTVSVASA